MLNIIDIFISIVLNREFESQVETTFIPKILKNSLDS